MGKKNKKKVVKPMGNNVVDFQNARINRANESIKSIFDEKYMHEAHRRGTAMRMNARMRNERINAMEISQYNREVSICKKESELSRREFECKFITAACALIVVMSLLITNGF